jgi:hypothetical protein
MNTRTPSESLIFVHIGKTAGTTFNFLIEYRFFEQNSFGAYDNNIDPKLRSSTGVFEPDMVAEILHRKERKRGKPFGFLPGHMRFGLHEYLDRPSTYITFVRDPIQRVVSAYNYVRSQGWLDENETLEEFVERDFLGNSDAMVRQLVNDPSLDSKADPALRHDARKVTEADFFQAMSNLNKHFAVAAPIGGFDHALLLLARHFGWPLSKLLYLPANVTRTKGPKAVITDRARELILERNQWDQRLYDAVESRFATRVERLWSCAPTAIDRYGSTMLAYRNTLSRRWSPESLNALSKAFEQEAESNQHKLADAFNGALYAVGHH